MSEIYLLQISHHFINSNFQ